MKRANIEKALEIYRTKAMTYTQLEEEFKNLRGYENAAVRYHDLASAYNNAAKILDDAIHDNIEVLREVQANL